MILKKKKQQLDLIEPNNDTCITNWSDFFQLIEIINLIKIKFFLCPDFFLPLLLHKFQFQLLLRYSFGQPPLPH